MPDPVEAAQAANAATQADAAGSAQEGEATGQEPAAKTYSEEDVKALRKEAASWRSKVRELEGKVSAFETAQLSEQEKAQKTAQEATAKAQAAEAALRAARAETAIAKAAAKHQVSADLLTKLVDVEFDDAGEPVGVEAAVVRILAAHPYLKPAVGVSPANPARVAVLTTEQIKQMTPDEINRRWDEVQAAMKPAGR